MTRARTRRSFVMGGNAKLFCGRQRVFASIALPECVPIESGIVVCQRAIRLTGFGVAFDSAIDEFGSGAKLIELSLDETLTQ